MLSTTIAAIADTHLRDSHLVSLERGPDFTRSLIWCIQYAIRHKLPAIIHGGDILNTNRPSSQNMADLMHIHQIAVNAKLPIYTVTGNHDLIKPSWIEMIEQAMGSSGYGFICADNRRFTIPGTSLTVQGFPFLGRQEFIQAVNNCEPADILVWHGQVREFVSFPVEDSVSVDDIPQNKFRAVLLGDIHEYHYINRPDNTLIGYPGSTELTEKGEAFEKYLVKVPFPDTGAVEARSLEQVVIPTRPCLAYRIADEADLGQVLADIEARRKDFSHGPLVFIRYNPEIPGVVARIKNVLPSNAIARYEKLEDNAMPLTASGLADMVEAGIELASLLDTFLVKGTSLHALGQKLTGPDVDAKNLIQEYVTNRLQELEAAQ